MRAPTICLMAFAMFASLTLAQTQPTKGLQIYVVDVEGGNATLFVAPGGDSVLIDTGKPTLCFSMRGSRCSGMSQRRPDQLCACLRPIGALLSAT